MGAQGLVSCAGICSGQTIGWPSAQNGATKRVTNGTFFQGTIIIIITITTTITI